MSKMKRMISTVLCTAFLMVQVLAISSFAFSPSESTKVNIFCGFESGDTLPMIMDPHGNPQINNPGGFKLELNSSEKYSGSKSVKASTATSEASGDPRCTFEWFPVFEGKNIHEQADLEEYYDAGNGYSFKGAEYLQLWVKNTSKSPLSLIWLTLYGKDKYQLKPTASDVTYLVKGEWKKLPVSNTYISIPAGYEGFIRVGLNTTNFGSGAWRRQAFDIERVTGLGMYIDNIGVPTSTLYIDDVALVGKNVNLGGNHKSVNEKAYFADYLKEFPAPETPDTDPTPTSSSATGNGGTGGTGGNGGTTQNPLTSKPVTSTIDTENTTGDNTNEDVSSAMDENMESDVTGNTEVNSDTTSDAQMVQQGEFEYELVIHPITWVLIAVAAVLFITCGVLFFLLFRKVAKIEKNK